MRDHVIIVFDCGATNIRVIAINQHGDLLSSKAFPNQTYNDAHHNGGRIWDAGLIWKKLSEACKYVTEHISHVEIIGVCTTTFGVDGAPFTSQGEMLYPVISWACQRTELAVKELHELILPEKLYSISGIAPFPFNTIYKLFWLKKHKPDVIRKMDHWLFMPSILNKHLCRDQYTDISMAGTSMLCDLGSRRFSAEILHSLGLNIHHFPNPVEAGEKIGYVSNSASRETGIPAGVPVFAAGHDTQFAIFGSGAATNEPVISSGTWEILMVRTQKAGNNASAMESGITTEFDCIPGLFNPGVQWIGSGILEWIKRNLFADIKDHPDIYNKMIDEAREARGEDVELPIDAIGLDGMIPNLNITAERGKIYKAALKALSLKTKNGLKVLEATCGFEASSILVAGGGSKNQLWNEIRAETLGIPVRKIQQSETTVLGAAMFAFAGAGFYPSAEYARSAFLGNGPEPIVFR